MLWKAPSGLVDEPIFSVGYLNNCLKCKRSTPAGTARGEDPGANAVSEAAEAVPAESERWNGKQPPLCSLLTLIFLKKAKKFLTTDKKASAWSTGSSPKYDKITINYHDYSFVCKQRLL